MYRNCRNLIGERSALIAWCLILLFSAATGLVTAAEDAAGKNPGGEFTKWKVEGPAARPDEPGKPGSGVPQPSPSGSRRGGDLLEDFLNHRADIRENISKWSGNTDPVWILHEWIKITTERGEDYQQAVYVSDLLAMEATGGSPPGSPGGATPPSGGSPSPGTGAGTSPGAPGPGTPPPSTAEPARDLDPRLAQMDVRVVPANVKSGQKYWRLVKAKFESDLNNESGGNHNIYVEPQFRAVVMWGGSHVDRVEKDYPIYAAGNAYDCKIGGPEPSDTVVGMGMMNPGNKGNKAHVNYRLWFQLVIKP